MSPVLTRVLAVAGAALVLGAANYAIAGKESVIRNGETVYLELAPVDPRSLMQGDYMALRYAIDNELQERLRATPGPAPRYAYLALDEAGRARLAGTGDALPQAPQQVAMRLRSRDGGHSIGPNAFFFEEGSAEAFAPARWGEFRVDAEGKALLTHLRDAQLQRLGEIRR
jgi:uncharacterized membrane-anchored protein